MLRYIRGYVKDMEAIDSSQMTCNTLSHYLSYFFFLVVRDRNISNSIQRNMANGSIGTMVTLSKTSLIDEVGVVIVDANFNLYGKMLFANKIILRMLGY